MPDEISAPGSLPDSEPSRSEEEDILTRARIARFSQSVLSEQAWFSAANELIAAMELLEPHIELFWDRLRAQVLDQKSDPEPEHSLVNVHMMLAGFAIENLCKGYLASRLTREERDAVKAGILAESLRGHDILEFVERTGMKLSETEKYLVKRIGEAIFWRGRYPSPTSHQKIGPFAQVGSDIRHIKAVLRKLRAHVRAKASHRNPASEPVSR